MSPTEKLSSASPGAIRLSGKKGPAGKRRKKGNSFKKDKDRKRNRNARGQTESVQRTVGLLQGPLGPFFADLADAFSERGVRTVRVLFNAGDRHFSKADVEIPFVLPKEDWEDFLCDLIKRERLSVLILYGDMRFYHRIAKKIAHRLDIPVWCFEEGYIRPGYVTFEEGGNNASSLFPERFLQWLSMAGSSAALQEHLEEKQEPVPLVVGSVIRQQIWFGICYYGFKDWHFGDFGLYHHHRSGSWLREMVCWIRAGFRKAFTTLFSKDLTDTLIEKYDRRLILVPLQVAQDTQVLYHSDFASIKEFIAHILTAATSFMDPLDHLVIKHHPMDRGHTHYGAFIRQKVTQLGIEGRVSYVQDIDLDRIFKHLKSCITINSTVASSCLRHGVPVLCLGRSMLAQAGLAQKADRLEEFISSPCKIKTKTFDVFQRYLKVETQIAGNFYKRRKITAVNAVEKLLCKINER